MESRTYIATPPGETIKEQLEYQNMLQKEFATRMGLSEKHVSRLINGEVQLTPDVAEKLEMVLGMPAQFWNNLEAIYREKLAKATMENELDVESALASNFPYSEMATLGWVPRTKNPIERVINLRKYFHVSKLPILVNNNLNNIACRRLCYNKKSDFTLVSWVQQAKILSRDIELRPFRLEKLVRTIPKIVALNTQRPAEFLPTLKELLAKCGVAIVFLPHLSGSGLQGATFYDNKRIVIGMTLRGKDADKFWFTLCHELAHICLGHLNQKDDITETNEEEANVYASNLLIPNNLYRDFLENHVFSVSTIKEFANSIKVQPGILVGRMQHDHVIAQNRFNNLKTKYEFKNM